MSRAHWRMIMLLSTMLLVTKIQTSEAKGFSEGGGARCWLQNLGVDQFDDQKASPLGAEGDNELVPVPGTKMSGRDFREKPTVKNGDLRLLVVDADVRVWDSVFQVLQSDLSEFICEVSIDGLENVLLSNSPFDVVLIDVYRPVEKFLELPSLIKAMAPRTEVIFISRFFDQQLRSRLLQSGAYECLPKALDENELRKAILNAVDQNRRSWSLFCL